MLPKHGQIVFDHNLRCPAWWRLQHPWTIKLVGASQEIIVEDLMLRVSVEQQFSPAVGDTSRLNVVAPCDFRGIGYLGWNLFLIGVSAI